MESFVCASIEAFLYPLPSPAFTAAVNRAKHFAQVLIRRIADIERKAAEAAISLFLSMVDAIRFWNWTRVFFGNSLNPIANYRYIVELDFANLSDTFHSGTNPKGQGLGGHLMLSHQFNHFVTC